MSAGDNVFKETKEKLIFANQKKEKAQKGLKGKALLQGQVV